MMIIVTCFTLAAVGCNKDKKEDKKAEPAPAKTTPSTAAPAKAKAAPAAPTAAKAAPAKKAAAGCAGLFARTSAQLGTSKIACIEGAMEKRGKEFDSKSCDGLENAWPLGMGDFAGLWSSCQKEQKFVDADCDAVIAACLK
jgi:hypothetical protein